jgi:hypothetical protein
VIKDNIAVSTQQIMEYFIKFVIPQKQKILNKDGTFFTEGKSLFGILPDEQAGVIRNVWLSNKLDQEDRDCIWNWARAFVVLAERYQKATSA